jgi:hypothetical protein
VYLVALAFRPVAVFSIILNGWYTFKSIPAEVSHWASADWSAGRPELRQLGVLPHQVVETADGRSANGGEVPMMVVDVQPSVKGPGSGRL